MTDFVLQQANPQRVPFIASKGFLGNQASFNSRIPQRPFGKSQNLSGARADPAESVSEPMDFESLYKHKPLQRVAEHKSPQLKDSQSDDLSSSKVSHTHKSKLTVTDSH